MTYEPNIVGALLHDPTKLDDVLDIIRPEQFEDKDCRLAYTAIIQLAAQGITPDLVTVAGRLRPTVTPLKLTQIMDTVASGSGAMDYAKQQHKLYRKHLFTGALQQLAVIAEDESTDADTLASGMQQAVNDIEDNTTEKQVDDSAAQASERYLRWIQDAKNGKIKLHPCHTIGLVNKEREIDSIIPYWLGGLSVIISAYTTTGKSAYAVNLALAEAEAGLRITIFTNEMSEMNYIDRAAGYFSNIPYGHIRYNLMHDIDVETITGAINRFSLLPIKIIERCKNSAQIIRRIKRLRYTFRPDIVIVDYLQRLQCKPNEKVYEGLTRQGLELVEAAKQFDFSLVMVSQIDNQSAREENHASQFMATKGTGDTSADADIFVLLTRDPMNDDKKHLLDLYVKKNRQFGRSGHNERLQFNASFTRIEERPVENKRGAAVRPGRDRAELSHGDISELDAYIPPNQ